MKRLLHASKLAGSGIWAGGSGKGVVSAGEIGRGWGAVESGAIY